MSQPSLLSQFRRGAIWTYSSLGASMLVQLGVTATTARLLDPADFGLIAMANVLLRLGNYVAQMGVGRALIQAPEIDELDVRAAFTSSTLLGVLVALVIVLIAPLAAVYYQTEDVIPVIRWLAVMFVVSGMGATAQALLRRNLRFRTSGVVEFMAYLLGYAAPALWLASAGFGVWSLVVAAIGQATVMGGLSYAFTRHSLRPLFAMRHHRRLLGFGSKVSGISLLEFLGSTLDTMIVGRFGTAAQLGLYNRAFMLASLPMYQINNGLAKVLFPVLASGQTNRAAFNETLDRVTKLAIKVVVPAGVGMAIAAPELVAVVLGPQWNDAAPLFAILAIGLAINLLTMFPGIALEALGLLRGKAIVQAAFVVLLATVLTGLIYATGFSLRNVTLVIATASLFRTSALFVLAARSGVYSKANSRRYARLTLGCALSSAALLGGVAYIARIYGLQAPLVVALTITTGLALLLVLLGKDVLRVVAGLRATRNEKTAN